MRNNLRLWIMGSAVVMVALLAGGWFLGAQPFLAAASAASDSAAQVASANQTAQIRIAGLAKQSAHIDELKAQEAAAVQAVPATLDANAFVAQVNAAAALAGVTVQAVTPGNPQAYAPPASIAAAQAVAAAAAQPAASPSPSPTAAPAPAAPVVPVLAASDPSISSTNFTVVPMTVSVKGSKEGTLQFTNQMQHTPRLFLVSSYALSTEGLTGGTTLATINGFIYTLKQ